MTVTTVKKMMMMMMMMIRVEAKDIHPLVLRVSAGEDRVRENSPPGSLVLDTDNQPVTFSVSDKDLSMVRMDSWICKNVTPRH